LRREACAATRRAQAACRTAAAGGVSSSCRRRRGEDGPFAGSQRRGLLARTARRRTLTAGAHPAISFKTLRRPGSARTTLVPAKSRSLWNVSLAYSYRRHYRSQQASPSGARRDAG
jgi:hypothetical protein